VTQESWRFGTPPVTARHSARLAAARLLRVGVDRAPQAMLRRHRAGAGHTAAWIHPLNLHESLFFWGSEGPRCEV